MSFCLYTKKSEPDLKDIYSPTITLILANAFYFNIKKKENKFFLTSIYKIKRLIKDKQALELEDKAKNKVLVNL